MAIVSIQITERTGYGLGRAYEQSDGWNVPIAELRRGRVAGLHGWIDTVEVMGPNNSIMSIHPIHALKGIWFDEAGIPPAPDRDTF